MSKSFEPHSYAAALLTRGNMASESKLLYQWVGSHWQVVDDEEAEVAAYHWLVASGADFASGGNAKQAVRAAVLFLPRLTAPTDDVVIPLSNGYVHLDGTQLVLLPADPALGIRHVLRCAYDPAATAPRFERFLQRALPDEAVRGRVQEFIGYTFLADTRFQAAQLWLGEGANGKGVLANIVQALHGNVAAVSLDALEGFKLSALVGANLVYADEVPRARINEQLIKTLIAGETVPVDRKHREPLSIRILGKWLVCGNHLPAVADHSAGFWRRWDIVPFGATVPPGERDPLLAKRIIKNELSGVLNWALQGLLRLLVRGRFESEVPAAMAAALQDAKMDTNSVLAWIDDADVSVGGACKATKADVFECYRVWCSANALQTLGSTQFWKRLRESHRGLVCERRRIRHAQHWVCNVQVPGLKAGCSDLGLED